MILNVIVDEQTIPLDVPESMTFETDDFFSKMDADMDKGWQMSREWVDELDREKRCQVAADRLLTAMDKENKQLTLLMAAYILKKLPGIAGVRIDTEGDMTATELIAG